MIVNTFCRVEKSPALTGLCSNVWDNVGGVVHRGAPAQGPAQGRVSYDFRGLAGGLTHHTIDVHLR